MTEANEEMGRDQRMKRTFDRRPIADSGLRAYHRLRLKKYEAGGAGYVGLEL